MRFLSVLFKFDFVRTLVTLDTRFAAAATLMPPVPWSGHVKSRSVGF